MAKIDSPCELCNELLHIDHETENVVCLNCKKSFGFMGNYLSGY